MLMALLYTSDNHVAAAALACDCEPYGDRYWADFHAASVSPGEGFETAYVEISDSDLCQRLLQLGFDDLICGTQLAGQVRRAVADKQHFGKAA